MELFRRFITPRVSFCVSIAKTVVVRLIPSDFSFIIFTTCCCYGGYISGIAVPDSKKNYFLTLWICQLPQASTFISSSIFLIGIFRRSVRKFIAINFSKYVFLDTGVCLTVYKNFNYTYSSTDNEG